MKKNLFVLLLSLMFFYNLNIKIALAENDKTNISTFLYDYDDTFINLVGEELIKLENENPEKIKIDFYDSNNNANTQMEQLQKVLKEGTDLILMNLVDPSTSDEVISMIKEYNIPVVIFNREPESLECIKSYGKAIFVGSDSWNLGNLQGEVIKRGIDSNRIKAKDDYIDYIMIMGYPGSKETTIRTEAVIDYMKNNNINSNEIERINGDFNRERAKELMRGLLIRYIDNLDLIISNNDEMAIGAIEALEDMGYNTGDPNRYVPVIGIDGIEEAVKLINEGRMEGTVVQSPQDMAKAILEIGLNLVENKEPLEGTNYEFDDSGVAVRLKGYEYITRK